MKSDAPMSAIESRVRRMSAAAILILVGAVSGCAHTNPRDPLEPFNRGVYTFNDTFDQMILKPVATGYRAVLPQFVRTGVRNFFSNLDDVTVVVNDVLQLKIQQAVSDAGRFLVNTTAGVLGFIDVATHVGLEKHNEDFGQTLGYWGVGSGAYLVLPFVGPSSIRDGIGRVVDYYTDLVWQIDDISWRNALVGIRAVSHREELLDSEKVLETAALDRYSFIRDAYLQRRRNLVYDGNPPPEPEEEAPPAKPRSELELPVLTILTDQFGNVVAAPAERVEPAAASPLAAPAAGAPAAQEAGSSTPVAEPQASSAPQAPQASVEQPAPRVVRVWLPGSAR